MFATFEAGSNSTYPIALKFIIGGAMLPAIREMGEFGARQSCKGALAAISFPDILE